MTHARTSPRRDAGMGLVEVMVGVVIFTIVTGLLTGFVIDMLRTGSGTTARMANVDATRVAMDELSKGLRVAVRPEQFNAACTGACDVALYAPAANAVSFYANYGDAAGPRLTTYQIVEDPYAPGTGHLIARHRSAGPPAALTATNTCGAGCTERVLARGLVWPVPTPAFSYADAGCTAFSAPTAPAAVTADAACVAIDIRVAGARDNPGTSVTSTVFLPNSMIGR